jgi:hypothetical protein
VDAVLLLGALAWGIAVLVGMAIVQGQPMELVLFLGGVGVLVAVAVGVAVVPRRLRWRGDIRPRSTVRPRFEPNRPLKPAQIAVEERWGVTESIEDFVWVREVGQLRWRGSFAYLVGEGTGLVLDPWFLSRRPYVFDDTCRVGPSPVPAALNPGLNLRRKNGVLRVSQGTQVIDLAVPIKSVPAVALVGAPAPIDEPATPSAAVAVSEERLARIARADRRAARRHAFFARINARSKANGWVAAACSLFYLGLGVGAFLVGVQLGQYGTNVVMLSMACLAAGGVYALRVVIQEKHESSSDEEQGK